MQAKNADVKFVLVMRTTRAKQVRARYASAALAEYQMRSVGQSYDEYAHEEESYEEVLAYAKDILGSRGHLLELERRLLPTYSFNKNDVIVVIGQDGLVANTLRYSRHLPVIGVNPDPARYEGTLLPFNPQRLGEAADAVTSGRARFRAVTLAQAEIAGGPTLVAANDLFIGKRDQSSARYSVAYRGQKERHSSSGIIISTPMGSTAWQRSVITGAVGIASALGGRAELRADPTPWEQRKLRFWTREPWPSVASTATLVAGELGDQETMELASEMGEGGIIFADGMQEDAVPFLAGSVITVTVAPTQAQLMVG